MHHRFGLSFRDVEDLLAEHRTTVMYETIRQWSPPLLSRHCRGSVERETFRPGETSRWGATVYVHPNCCRLTVSFQILVTWRIWSPSNSIA